jgi:hypothetical protein
MPDDSRSRESLAVKSSQGYFIWKPKVTRASCVETQLQCNHPYRCLMLWRVQT